MLALYANYEMLETVTASETGFNSFATSNFWTGPDFYFGS